MEFSPSPKGAKRGSSWLWLAPLLLVACLVPHTIIGGEDTQRPPAGMLRHPAISAEYIAFGYATQLWIAPRDGGIARPVASPAGSALFPAFSPDGRHIAFLANYDGQRDIHVIPTEGGVPRRLTTHPGQKHIHGWSRDGESVVYSTTFFSGNGRYAELFKVAATGGTPEKLPVPYGVNATFSPDGREMAYMPHSRDFRTWKRYAGGRASNLWIFHLEDHTSEQITTWEGTDTLPMWHGDAVYFLSDKDEPWRLNIWRLDRTTGARERITDFAQHDVRFPSLGPGTGGGGEIVFQLGQKLKVLDLATRETRVVDVEIPGALPKIRPRVIDASGHIENRSLSPTGARVIVEARGDLWSLPARRGSARNLTRTRGTAEREPAWSPDGKWILHSSDATGEYHLHLIRADGTGEPRRITADHETYWENPRWAPDGKRFVVTDKSQRIWYGEVPEDGAEPAPLREIGFNPGHRWIRLDWSPDSRWIVYSRTEDDGRFTLSTSALWAVEVETGETHRLTGGMFSASSPAFDPKGEFLAFTAASEFSEPQYEDIGTTFVYHRTGRIVLVPLRDDIASPLLPKSDEEDATETENENGNGENGNGEEDNGEAAETPESEGNDQEEKEEEEERMDFHWEGFERRAILLPIERGNFGTLAFNEGRQLLYQRMTGNRRWGGESRLQLFDPFKEDPSEETVIDAILGFSLSADRKKALVTRRGAMAVIDAAANQQWEHPVDTSTMRQRVAPREEWAQILRDAWRRHRDFFYVENMHGVDWDQVWEDYSALLPYLSSRGDLQFVIGEMIGELNAGHAYVWGGDFADEPEVAVGSLGADFAWTQHDGAWGYRIERIHTGGPWDYDARGPLSQPGLDVSEGDFILALNGVPLDAGFDPWAALAGLADQVVTLRVASSPHRDAEDARDLVTRTLRGDRALRYRAWVESNRRHVEERGGGRVGYIHVPSTAVDGQNELFRQYFGQRGKEALLIDERWNAGGQLPHRFVELLNRPFQSYWARRDGKDWATPADGFSGPMAMLINEISGSGGDAFPHFFRENGLGKLIGMRTWGGLIGITGVPNLIDGGYTAVPTFGIYSPEGRWIIEGYGVAPDIEVVDDPALMVDGGDPQLDAAIDHLLGELERNPFVPPDRPAPPDRSGFGIDPEHR